MVEEGGGAAKHRSSFRAGHPAALGSNLSPAEIFLYCLVREHKRSKPSSANAKDFAKAVQRRPKLSTAKNH